MHGTCIWEMSFEFLYNKVNSVQRQILLGTNSVVIMSAFLPKLEDSGTFVRLFELMLMGGSRGGGGGGPDPPPSPLELPDY